MRRETDQVISRVDKARTLLAEAKNYSQAKQVADMAHAAAIYAKRQKLSQETIEHATAIQVDAQTLMGEFLKVTDKAKGARGTGSNQHKKVRSASGTAPTYAQAGINKKEAAEAQQLAEIKKQSPRLHADIRSGKKSITQAKRELKEKAREARRDENRGKIAVAKTIDDAVKDARFSTIVIDPPWDWGDEGDQDQLGRARPQYATMTIEQLLDLPLAGRADEDCHLYLWITNRSLPKGFQLLDSWGFRYVTCLTWCKPSFGMGNYFRGQTEHVLFGVKGSQLLKRKDIGTCFTAPRGPGGHSSKPVEFYALVESCSPGPYLEVFAREPRSGWTCWGGEL